MQACPVKQSLLAVANFIVSKCLQGGETVDIDIRLKRLDICSPGHPMQVTVLIQLASRLWTQYK